MMHATTTTSLLLDAQAIRELFARELPALAHAEVRACRIQQTRRRISRKTEEQGAPYLGVVYALEVADRASGMTCTQWLYAKAYGMGKSADAWRNAAGAPTHLPTIDALVWTLPNDPAMTRLTEFLDADAVRTHLAAMLDGAGVENINIQIVRHEPEEHCTARFTFDTPSGRRTCYGKTYADDGWQTVAGRIDNLHACSQSDPRAFLIATPLGTSAALHAVWQAEVLGTPLRSMLDGKQSTIWVTRVAQALCRLHASPLRGETLLTPQMLLERTIKQCHKLVRADASFARSLGVVLDGLQRDLPTLDMCVPIHGDFHVDQMLCSGERVVLFDFDNVVEGSAAHDVADFVSQLLTDEDHELSETQALAGSFINSYMAVAMSAPNQAELDWYLRLLLLRKAYSFFVRHRDGWHVRVAYAITLATEDMLTARPSMELAA